jgi:sulfotransferase family protein
MSDSALSGAGPAWLGIGAQRSGTTWFTDLLTQHPAVGLGTNGKKEQHLLHKVADGVVAADGYLSLFPAEDGVRRGEWTPQYLRHASVPAAAARLVPAAPVLVLLRDPVERFRSAMRLAATRAAAGNPSPWPYPVPITMQTFTGFYADQLDGWAAVVGRERMVVMVYEQVRRSPDAAVREVWRRLGLDPVPLAGVGEASGSSSRAGWDWPEGLRETLQVMYRPQLARLESDWGLDVSDWTATGR